MIKKFYKKLTFLQGVAITICLTSIISIAATNLPGFFVFSPGTPISSSEVNANFEKLAGQIVVKATMSTGISLSSSIVGDFTIFPDCATCNTHRAKINFDTVSVNDGNFKQATDTDTNSSTLNSAYSYYEVLTTGWYELRLLNALTYNMTTGTCTTPQCSHNIYSSINIYIGSNIANINKANPGSMYMSAGKWENDTNNDSIFDSSSTNEPVIEAKKIYLKVGQVIFVKYEAGFSETGIASTYSASSPANTIDLTLIKL